MSNTGMAERWIELVDEQGNVYDTARREDVHGNPSMIHSAVHLFVVNEKGEIFLQKRAKSKMVEPDKWDTSVGGHVQIGESYLAAVKREAQEELGIRAVQFEKMHRYIWKSAIETEIVQTFICHYQGPFSLNKAEIQTGHFWTISEIREQLRTETFTPNFEEEFARYLSWRKKNR